MFNLLPRLALLTLPLLAAFAFAQSPATVIDLSITGGPLEGRYEAVSEDATCSYGYAFSEDSWGNQYSIETTDPTTFSSLQLIVPNSSQAAGGAGEFVTTVSFGELFTDSETSYTINTQNARTDEGTGIVTVQDEGDTALVTISGTTAEGVGIEATITCNRVLRAAGGSSSAEADAPSGSLELSVTGETFSLPTGDEAGCSRDYAEEGDLFYSFYGEGNGLSNVELMLPDLEAAGTGSEAFYVSVNDQAYYLDTTAGNSDGSGLVTATRSGDALTLTLDVVTADGVPIQGTLTCP